MVDLEQEFIKKLLHAEELRLIQNKNPLLVPLREVTVIKSFLQLRPNYIVRRCSFKSSYELDRVWPEVILLMDKNEAIKLKNWLVEAYTIKNGESSHSLCSSDSGGSVSDICIYRVDKYSDDAFYKCVHRVPISLHCLRSLADSVGLVPADNIIEV